MGDRAWPDDDGMADFIPTQDAQFMLMADAFVRTVAKHPARYMVSHADAQMLTNVVAGFVDAMARTGDTDTRTSPAITAKNTARNAARNVIRMFANQFRANMAISDEDLTAIKVHRRPQTLSPRKCPTISPQLAFIATTPGSDTLRFRDAINICGESRKKPYGAERLELFVAYLDDQPFNGVQPPDDAKYLRSFRKNPIVVEHDKNHRGRKATYWGRWAGHNDDVGPWSLPVSLASPGQSAGAEPTAKKSADEQPLKQAA